MNLLARLQAAGAPTTAAEEEEQLDRALSHECGHAFLAELLTEQPATVNVERRTDGVKVWYAGSCTHAVAATPNERAAIALAGAIAEALCLYPYSRGGHLLRTIASLVSPSDARGAGYFDRRHIDTTVKIVSDNMAEIRARVETEKKAYSSRQGNAGVAKLAGIAADRKGLTA